MFNHPFIKDKESYYLPTLLLFITGSFIFCGYSSINALFYITIIAFIIKLTHQKTVDTISTGIIFVIFTLLYFSMTLLWSSYSGDFIKYIRYSLCIISFIYIMSYTYQRNRILLLNCILIASTLSSLVAIFSINNLSSISIIRLPSPYGPENVIDFAGYCAIGFIIGLYLTLGSKKIEFIALYSCLSIINLAACLLTQSRGPILYMTICSLLLMRKKNIKITLFLFSAIIALVISLSMTNIINLGELASRFLSLNTELNGSQGYRGAIWEFSLSKIIESPFFGHGILTPLNYLTPSNTLFTTTHNVYIGSLFTGGVVGFSFFIIMCATTLKSGIKIYKDDPLPVVLFLYALMHISSQWKFLIMSPDAPWFIFWMPLAFNLYKKQNENKS